MHSMTGFGKGEAEASGRRLSVEVKTVNNRYLDCAIKTPRGMTYLEEPLRAQVGQRLARGRADVHIYYQNIRDDAKSVRVDRALAQAYLAALEELRTLAPLAEDTSLSSVAGWDAVLTVEEGKDDEAAVLALLQAAGAQALEALVAMRRREGEKLAQDIRLHLAAMEEKLLEIEARAPQVAQEYRARLAARIGEYLEDLPLDEAKLANEVAHYAERIAIDEEIARLKSHLHQMQELLCQEAPVGRQLDFLTQELNREVNTICSKANDLVLTNGGLFLKNEVEKIREQVQNIE